MAKDKSTKNIITAGTLRGTAEAGDNEQIAGNHSHVVAKLKEHKCYMETKYAMKDGAEGEQLKTRFC